MSVKIANELLHNDKEFTKLQASTSHDTIPREMPGQQASGYRGLHKPALKQWTHTELRQMAELLGFARSGEMSRDELVNALARSGRR